MVQEVGFEEFSRIELRVGLVKNAEKVPGSEKLIKLIVDLGPLGERQIIAGLGKWYTPEYFVGRYIIVVSNLKPKKMMGLESKGMLLATDTDPPIIATVEKPAAPGSRLM